MRKDKRSRLVLGKCTHIVVEYILVEYILVEIFGSRKSRYKRKSKIRLQIIIFRRELFIQS